MIRFEAIFHNLKKTTPTLKVKRSILSQVIFFSLFMYLKKGYFNKIYMAKKDRLSFHFPFLQRTTEKCL